MISMSEACTILSIEDYVPPPLKTLTDSDGKYSVVHGGKTFTMEYNEREASLLKVECDGCTSFLKGKQQFVKVSYTNKLIEIKSVYLGVAKGQKICSLAVAYLIKLCMMKAAEIKEWPYEGRVHISSKNECQAYLCYTHAFAMNGFILPVNEIKNFFFEIGWQKKQAFFDYILRGFVNEEQKQAYATTGWQERPLAKESNFFGREMGVHLKF